MKLVCGYTFELVHSFLYWDMMVLQNISPIFCQSLKMIVYRCVIIVPGMSSMTGPVSILIDKQCWGRCQSPVCVPWKSVLSLKLSSVTGTRGSFFCVKLWHRMPLFVTFNLGFIFSITGVVGTLDNWTPISVSQNDSPFLCCCLAPHLPQPVFKLSSF